ncbi:MAG: SGNH/GDSL hydrolase family protein [Defluviicoccus sp.]|nr:MAG: SGNH/GDSL hydrolase family protein [Defluviicoccus sp.]
MPRYTTMVVFGDSLSDNGNAGHYSNGPPWVEVLAKRLGLPLRPSRSGGNNYAVGGALTHGSATDLRGQVVRYLASHDGRADPQALYVLYAGANDLLRAGCMTGRDTAARTAAAALGASVADLANAGARTILVPNLPDIGYAPVVRAHGAACTAEASRLTRVLNAALEDQLRKVENQTHVHIHRLDAYGLMERLMADPEAAGFHDVTTPCLRDHCDGQLFWDYLHPTAAAHATLAAAALAVLQADGERE